MAKIHKSFLDKNDECYIQTLNYDQTIRIEIYCCWAEYFNTVDMDINTAVKFSKELRLMISQAKEREVSNG